MKAKLMLLDLTKQCDLDVLVNMLLTANIAYCHCAPVCGTGSRAREIPLPAGMEHLRAEPLRSAEHPLGLPRLQGTDYSRVIAANKLYFITLVVCYIAAMRGFLISVENPSNAYFWLAVQALSEQYPELARAWFACESTHFQACEHGAERDKWTCWFGSPQVFTQLRAKCTHQHPKGLWRPYFDSSGRPVFPTKAEAAYPELLCQRVATIVKQAAVDRGARADQPAFLPAGAQEEVRAARRHGWANLPPLIAEYMQITDKQPAERQFKLLTSLPVWGKRGDEYGMGCRGTEMVVSSEYKLGDPLYGVYRSHEEFVQAALHVRHPIDYACSVPEILVENIAKVLNDGPKLVVARRRLEVLKVKRLAKQLASEEEKLHSRLNPELAKVLEGKNLLVWRELMKQTGFNDPTLFDELTSGFKLVGQAHTSPQFPKGFVSMQQSPEELRSKAVWMRKANTVKCKSTGRPELDELVWQQTLEECQAGWMHGPYTEEQVSGLVGSSNWLATRRFPLEQKDKVRLIDDALASGLNSAYGTSNKLTLFDIDTLAALTLQVAKAIQQRSGSIACSEGSSFKLNISGLWKQPLRVLGRTLDLQSAYKQVGPCMDDIWNRVIMVFDPKESCPKYFVSSALMFGATAAVYAFNRISKSIWHILTHLLSLWMTVYYDDFPMVEPEETSSSAEECMAEILDILGWKFARSGSKAPPFATTFDVLGVTVDLLRLHEGAVTLKNKQSRVVALSAALDKLVCEGRVESGVAASLHGQLNFAQGQYLGAPLKPAMRFFSEVASRGWDESFKPKLAVACLFARNVLRRSQPKAISLSDEERPVLVFSDGAWEPEGSCPAGAGFVVVDPATGTRLACEVLVPQVLIDHWKSLGKSQLIAELELLPVVVFFQQYRDLCKGRRVILFVDNNAIRDSIAKGSSTALSVMVLLSELHRLWAEAECLCWVTRVPTKSNVADLPSRQQTELAAKVINGCVAAPVMPDQKLCDLICNASTFVEHMRQFLQ